MGIQFCYLDIDIDVYLKKISRCHLFIYLSIFLDIFLDECNNKKNENWSSDFEI